MPYNGSGNCSWNQLSFLARIRRLSRFWLSKSDTGFQKKIAMNFIPDLNIGDLTFTPQDANVIRCDVFPLLMPLCLNFPRLSECLQGVLLASVFSRFFCLGTPKKTFGRNPKRKAPLGSKVPFKCQVGNGGGGG